MNLQELKNKEPEQLIKQADKLQIENPSALRKQDLMFAILKKIALDGETITGSGVIEIIQDGFGFLRSPESNYLAAPNDIYVSPSQIKKFTEAQRKAEVKQTDITYKERDHAWFVAFAPVEDPKYAISVLVEHGGSGSKAAAPVAKKVIKKIIERHKLRSVTKNKKFGENI